MSPLFRDELRIVLTPDQVLLTRIGRSLTWRGLTRTVLEKEAVPCMDEATRKGDAPVTAAPWEAAVKTLESALSRNAGRKAFATVILSNHFMRYALLPWSDVPNGEAEEMAYARHAFRQAYGDAAETWELRLSHGGFGMPQLASAVDQRLTAALRDLSGRAGIELESVQPHLMTAYNTCHAILRERSAWFVLAEPGNLCIALLCRGRLESLRTMRLEGDSRLALPMILERESLLAESAAPVDEVFLWAPWLADAQIPSGKRWKFWKLRPLLRNGLAQESDPRFAVALSGCA